MQTRRPNYFKKASMTRFRILLDWLYKLIISKRLSLKHVVMLRVALRSEEPFFTCFFVSLPSIMSARVLQVFIFQREVLRSTEKFFSWIMRLQELIRLLLQSLQEFSLLGWLNRCPRQRSLMTMLGLCYLSLVVRLISSHLQLDWAYLLWSLEDFRHCGNKSFSS